MYQLLKELTEIHAVAGFEEKIEEYIKEFAITRSLPYQHTASKGVIIGNPDAETYWIAHTDEVGGWINFVSDTLIRFQGVGWVNPSGFVGAEVEILTDQGVVYGLVIAPEPLREQYEEFSSLNILVAPEERKKVQRGNPVRFRTRWSETAESITATALDNRIGVVQLLELINQNKEHKELFAKNAFCFCGQEEDRNQGAMYYMMKYKPETIYILDIIPHSIIGGEDGKIFKKPYILTQSQDYKVDKVFLTQKIKTEYEVLETETTLLNRSEAMQYENATGGKALNIFTPVYNYHHGPYFVYKQAIENTLTLANDIIS